MNSILFKGNHFHKYIIIVCCLIAVVLIFFLVLINIGGKLDNSLYSEPLYVYSILIFMFSFILASLILYKNKTLTPSILLIFFFIAVPIIGSFGYHCDVYGSFHGTLLKFAYPTFVWAIGTTALVIGVLFSHFVVKLHRKNFIVQWDLKRATFLLWLTIGTSLIFTVFVLTMIGYIPVLHSNINPIRGGYANIAGDYPVKFSRLWLVAVPLSTMLAFLKNKKRYFYIALISSLPLIVYGQRMYLFLAITAFALIFHKFQKIKLNQFIMFSALLVIAFIFYGEFRGGRLSDTRSVQEIVAINLFAEWREYAYVVNEIRQTGDYFKEEIFIGALSPILPKQIWAVFGIDKNYLIHEYSAAYVFGRKFSDYLGIRIGTIGEAYAGYGLYYGVCLQMFLFGLLFGVLEKIYLNLNKQDARLCIVCFLISLFIYLPITTLFVTMACAVYFGFFFLLYQFIGTERVFSPMANHTAHH